MLAQLVKLLLLIALIGVTAVQAAEDDKKKVYKWVNDDGSVVFSDTPQEGAEEVTISKPTTYSSANAPKLMFDDSPEQAQFKYSSLSIASPAHDEAIRDNTGNVGVQINWSPNLQPGHAVVLEMDGQQVAPPSSSSAIMMKDVPRGTHSLVAKILDDKGKVLQSSEPVTFHLHRYSVLTAPNRSRP